MIKVTNDAGGAGRFLVRLDNRRRPTLPAKLLDQLGIRPGDSLIASINQQGVLVLETPQRVKQRLRSTFATPPVEEVDLEHDHL